MTMRTPSPTWRLLAAGTAFCVLGAALGAAPAASQDGPGVEIEIGFDPSPATVADRVFARLVARSTGPGPAGQVVVRGRVSGPASAPHLSGGGLFGGCGVEGDRFGCVLDQVPEAGLTVSGPLPLDRTAAPGRVSIEVWVEGTDQTFAGSVLVGDAGPPPYEFEAAGGTPGLGNPVGVAATPDGGMVISDRSGQAIGVDAAGSERWRAGGPGVGRRDPGDLPRAGDVAVTPDGTAWVVGDEQVVAFGPDGEVAGVAGVGSRFRNSAGRAAVAVGPDGEVFVVDPTQDVVLEYGPDGELRSQRGRPADLLAATVPPGSLAGAEGVAVGPDGTLWVASRLGRRIDRFDPDGRPLEPLELATRQRTFGPDPFPQPVALTVDLEGHLHVAFAGGGRDDVHVYRPDGTLVRRYDGPDGAPHAMATGPDGDIYLTHNSADGVLVFGPDGSFRHTIGAEHLGTPRGIALAPDGRLFVADTLARDIAAFGPGGELIGRTDRLPARPSHLAVTPGGDLVVTYATGTGFSTIRAGRSSALYDLDTLAPTGTRLERRLVALVFGEAPGHGPGPYGIDADEQGRVWITTDSRIVTIGSDGTPLGETHVDFLDDPFDVAVNPDGTAWVLFRGFQHPFRQLRRLSADGSVLATVPLSGVEPDRIASDGEGGLWMTDELSDQLVHMDAEGTITSRPRLPGPAPGMISKPTDVDVLPEGTLLVAEGRDDFGGNGRVQHLTTELAPLAEVGARGSTAGRFASPQGLAFTGSDLLIANHGYGRIERLDADDRLVAFYDRSPLFEGINTASVAVDPHGNIYTPGHKLTSDGTVAGEWGRAPGGISGFVLPVVTVAVDGLGRIHAGDHVAGQVVTFDGADDAIVRRLTGIEPRGLAATADGTLYVSDALSQSVLVVHPQGAVVGELRPVEDPRGIAVAADGTVYVAEAAPATVAVFSPDGTRSGTLGGPEAGQVRLTTPVALALRPDGSLYVGDVGTDRVEVLSPDGASLGSIGGRLPAHGQLDSPTAVAGGPGGVRYVADTGNHRVVKLGPTGEVLAVLDDRGERPGELRNPYAIALDPAGDVWVADSGNRRLQKLDPDLRPLVVIGSRGTGPGQLESVGDVAITPSGIVYATDPTTFRVQAFDLDGSSLFEFRPRNQQGGLHGAGSIAVDTDGESLWVANSVSQELVQLGGDGRFLRQLRARLEGFAGQDSGIAGLAVEPSGRLAVTISDGFRDAVLLFHPDAPEQVTTIARGASRNAPPGLATGGRPGGGRYEFNGPVGISVDGHGTIHLADSWNHRAVALRPVPVPTAEGDAYAAVEDQPLVVPAPGVLDNDTHPGGVPLSAALVAGPAHGNLTLGEDGSFTYQPHPGFTGPDAFAYQSQDGVRFSEVSLVGIEVTAAPRAPRPPNRPHDPPGPPRERPPQAG
jgi:tripartite motif-containing protein 71